MRDQSLLYWGMVVTSFLIIAAMITARELFEMYMEKRSAREDEGSGNDSSRAGRSAQAE